MPKKRKRVVPYRHESIWLLDCAQNACGTSGVWYPCTRRGKKTSDIGVYGGPGIAFDPGYGAVVRVTMEVVREGKNYPPNPYPQPKGRGVDRKKTPISKRPRTSGKP